MVEDFLLSFHHCCFLDDTLCVCVCEYVCVCVCVRVCVCVCVCVVTTIVYLYYNGTPLKWTLGLERIPDYPVNYLLH